MNKLGDVIKGDVIGKRSKEWFVWTTCPNCGLERWVRRGKTELQTYTGWCQSCSARRNNKMRGYNKSEGSLAWKGGRTTDHGYVLVLLQPDDFFYPMTKHDGYVREHRLVMAKHLNRCLLPWEVVHHKGIKYALGSVENKQDNRMENLELLGSSGKHNKEIERLIKQARNEGFKAGIKEVVGWLEKEHKMYAYREINGGRKEDTYGVFVDADKWQAKLKEWGI